MSDPSFPTKERFEIRDVHQQAESYGINVQQLLTRLKVVQSLQANDCLETTIDHQFLRHPPSSYRWLYRRLWHHQDRQHNVRQVSEEVGRLFLVGDLCIGQFDPVLSSSSSLQSHGSTKEDPPIGVMESKAIQLFYRCLSQMSPLCDGISQWKQTYRDDEVTMAEMQAIIDRIVDKMVEWRGREKTLEKMRRSGYSPEIFQRFFENERSRQARKDHLVGTIICPEQRHGRGDDDDD